jgi:16S rRNA (guanine527-N7)-methyltransferase
MTEDEAQGWLVDNLNVSRETLDRLEHFRQMVVAEAAIQNLISASTLDHIWSRHIVDSAQLIPLVPRQSGQTWLDLGTGAGFPGIIVAILDPNPIHLVEERRGRIDFLARAVDELGLTHCAVHGCKLQALRIAPVDVISARAFAPMEKLLTLAHSFSTQNTRWLLPKGKSAQAELESVNATWHGMFHVKHSVTDPEAAIIVGSGVKKVKHR